MDGERATEVAGDKVEEQKDGKRSQIVEIR